MNAGAPTCSTCGGRSPSAHLTSCHHCGAPLAPPSPPAGYGAPPGGAFHPVSAPVHGFGGAPPFHYAGSPAQHGDSFVHRFLSGRTAFFWIRLVIAAVVLSLSLLGACVSALSH